MRGMIIALVVLLAAGAAGYREFSLRLARSTGAAGDLPVAAAAANNRTTRALLNQYAAQGAAKLASMYDAGSERATRSWRGANALATIIQYMQVSGSVTYLDYVSKTYDVHIVKPHPFLNRYYDDEGWWALTWIRAYDLTGDPNYLALARYIFANLTRGWTPACGGGLLWSKFSPYKDAISNGLFLEIAAQLHTRVAGDRQYGRWAVREWNWFRHSGMITRSGLVVDGLDPATCKPLLGSPTWTYNQGVVIGGLVALERFSHQPQDLNIARRIAWAVLESKQLSQRGILTEPPCGTAPTCAKDSPTFKGVFMQNLNLLYQRVHVPAFETYLLRNAISLWAHDRKGTSFGFSWAGPYDSSDTARQLSAMDLLNTQVTGPGAAAPGQVAQAPGASAAPVP